MHKLDFGFKYASNIYLLRSVSPSSSLFNNAFCLPSTFFKQFSYMEIGTKIENKHSIPVTNSDLQCRSPQLRSQNFMPRMILNINFIKRELKIGHP